MVGGESRVEVAGGECWVEVYGGESSLLWLGERPGAREALEGRRVVLVVPGNPGLAAFYQEFLESLHLHLGEAGTSLWATSHIGHEARSPALLPTDRTYTLEEQVEHKLALIDLLLPPSARITLVGHSIGCRMVIDILQRNTTHTFDKVYLLFPTMERMLETAQGAATWPLTTTWRPLLLALLTLLHLVVPGALLRRLLALAYPGAPGVFLAAAARWRNPNYLNNCLVMAKDELETVLELDTARLETLRKHAGRVRAYYGASDGWSPLEYREDLLERVPELGGDRLQVCGRGIAHAFVERSGAEMGEVVAAWCRQ